MLIVVAYLLLSYDDIMHHHKLASACYISMALCFSMLTYMDHARRLNETQEEGAISTIWHVAGHERAHGPPAC